MAPMTAAGPARAVARAAVADADAIKSWQATEGPVKYRAATAADAEAAGPMLIAHYALHAQFDAARFTPRPGFEAGYVRWLAQRADDPRSVFFVAETETPPVRLAGFVVGTVEREIPVYTLREYGFIHDLWVEPMYRHEGVGRQLVMLAVEGLLKRGVSQVRAEAAWVNAAARGLLERAGFRPSTVVYLLEAGSASDDGAR